MEKWDEYVRIMVEVKFGEIPEKLTGGHLHSRADGEMRERGEKGEMRGRVCVCELSFII